MPPQTLNDLYCYYVVSIIALVAKCTVIFESSPPSVLSYKDMNEPNRNAHRCPIKTQHS